MLEFIAKCFEKGEMDDYSSQSDFSDACQTDQEEVKDTNPSSVHKSSSKNRFDYDMKEDTTKYCMKCDNEIEDKMFDKERYRQFKHSCYD